MRRSSRSRAVPIPSKSVACPLEVPVVADDTDDPDDPDHEIVRTEPRDQTEAIVDAVRELESEPAGDVLVLSGEREIRDTAEALRDALSGDTFPTEILPLYARLPTADQQKVFSAKPGGPRRIVLATNVAEDLTARSLASGTSSTRARRASRGTAGAPRCSGCRSNRSRRRRPRGGPAGPVVPLRVCVSGCTRKRTSRRGLATPTRRSCAPTSARSPRTADGGAGARRYRGLPVPGPT